MFVESHWIAGLLGAVLFITGCDSAEPPPQDTSAPVTPDRLTLEFVPDRRSADRLAVTAEQVSDSTLRTTERLTVRADTYQVVIQAFKDTQRIGHDVFYAGPGTEVLRYAFTGGLTERFTVESHSLASAPMDSTLALTGRPPSVSTESAAGKSEGGDASPAKTPPLLAPGFFATVRDTIEAEGVLYLALERYESNSAFRRGGTPWRTDFVAAFPLRTVPAGSEK